MQTSTPADSTGGSFIKDTTNIQAGTEATLTFRPDELKISNDSNESKNIQPYCKIKLGNRSGRTSVASFQNSYIKWDGTDTVVLERKHQEQYAKVKVKDKGRMILRDTIGEAKVSIEDLMSRREVHQNYALYKHGKYVGEIVLNIEYETKPPS